MTARGHISEIELEILRRIIGYINASVQLNGDNPGLSGLKMRIISEIARLENGGGE